MNRFQLMMLAAAGAGAGSLCAAGAASAAPPAWCKGASAERPDLQRLSSKDAREVITGLVAVECGTPPGPDDSGHGQIEGHHAEIEAARQAWSSRLGMTEADWADAVAYAQTPEHSIAADVTSKTLAAATPIDQYAVIKQVNDPGADLDPLYATDMFEAHLSETGRLAFLETACFNNGQSAPVDASGMTGTEVIWAICQADLDRFDAAKLFDELRADTSHGGAIRMKLRVAAYELPRRIKDHAAEVSRMLQRDDASKKLFETAAAGRTAWAAAIGKNTRLLDLVLAMDSAAITRSRKQLEGCGDATEAALAEAVSEIPARAFAGMHDDRDNPSAGFATSAGPVLAGSAAVNLAAIAFLRCTPDADLSAFLREIVAAGPPSRGPRSAALARIKSARIAYDKAGATLIYPRPRPFGAAYLEGTLQARSTGGAVKSMKRAGDTLAVELQQTLVKQRDCVRSHETGKVSRIRGDGTVEYQEVCDRSEVRAHDHTWTPFQLSAKYAAWLKPGVVLSSTGKDVIAVWPSAAAKLPSIVLGGKLK
ncbi:MAG TPA: hypothetical protein VGD37_18555 [Kofleriaceae bacterium]